jgi:hypothetical protein
LRRKHVFQRKLLHFSCLDTEIAVERAFGPLSEANFPGKMTFRWRRTRVLPAKCQAAGVGSAFWRQNWLPTRSDGRFAGKMAVRQERKASFFVKMAVRPAWKVYFVGRMRVRRAGKGRFLGRMAIRRAWKADFVGRMRLRRAGKGRFLGRMAIRRAWKADFVGRMRIRHEGKGRFFDRMPV